MLLFQHSLELRPQGLEPWTNRLRVYCSTSWAKGAYFCRFRGTRTIYKTSENLSRIFLKKFFLRKRTAILPVKGLHQRAVFVTAKKPYFSFLYAFLQKPSLLQTVPGFLGCALRSVKELNRIGQSFLNLFLYKRKMSAAQYNRRNGFFLIGK